MTPTWTTRDFNGSNAWESIASSRVGQKKECPMMKFCAAVLSASTRSTRFCNGDEGDVGTTDSGPARSTSCAVLCRGAAFLAEARVHLISRTDRPEREHADRIGRQTDRN